MLRQAYISTNIQSLIQKIAIGFAALASTAIIGTSAIAGATPANKPTKEQCKAAGFQNYGQCVKEWAHNKNHPGGGYGGGTTASANTNVKVKLNHSNHNIINVVINYFFG